jgi:hypothetical protein
MNSSQDTTGAASTETHSRTEGRAKVLVGRALAVAWLVSTITLPLPGLWTGFGIRDQRGHHDLRAARLALDAPPAADRRTP